MRLLSLAPLAVLIIQAAVTPLQQQQPKPQGSIEGAVTRQGTGQPLTAAQVRLTRRGGPAQSAVIGGQPAQLPAPVGGRGAAPAIAPVMTDDRGKFVFQGLEEGSYIVQVQANGYVLQTYGQRYFNGPGTPIALTANQSVKDVNVSLTPAATLSGRIRDTADQPLINVPVQLLRYSYNSSGQRTYESVGLTETNDRGEYRLYWVTPGRYYLLAGRPSTGASPLAAMMMAASGATRANGNEVPAVPGYAFYPGVTEIGSARTIDLQPGADLQAVDLILTPKPQTYSIRGKLVDSRTGKPPVRASVSVAPQTPGGAGVDEFFLLGAPNQNYNPSLGTFEINGLLPGPYTVTATAQDPLLPGLSGPSTQFSSGSMPLAITSSDVEGIAISVVPAGQIPGRLRVEGQLPANLTIERIRIRLVPVGAGAPQPSRVQVAGQPVATPAANVATDGTFRFNNVIPGEYRPEITPAGATVFLKEARLEGADVLNSPLRFSGNTNSGLDIVIAVGGGQIVGVLNDARSQALPSTRVVLIPDRARYRSDLYRTAATDQTGRFAFNGIAPGDYKVFSWESVEDNGWFDPEVLVRAEGRGRSVHVTETSTETIDVRVIPQEGTR